MAELWAWVLAIWIQIRLYFSSSILLKTPFFRFPEVIYFVVNVMHQGLGGGYIWMYIPFREMLRAGSACRPVGHGRIEWEVMDTCGLLGLCPRGDILSCAAFL